MKIEIIQTTARRGDRWVHGWINLVEGDEASDVPHYELGTKVNVVVKWTMGEDDRRSDSPYCEIIEPDGDDFGLAPRMTYRQRGSDYMTSLYGPWVVIDKNGQWGIKVDNEATPLCTAGERVCPKCNLPLTEVEHGCGEKVTL